MISISWCQWVPKPCEGWTRSSLTTLRQPNRFLPPCHSAKEKWNRLLSQFLLVQHGWSGLLGPFPNHEGSGSETKRSLTEILFIFNFSKSDVSVNLYDLKNAVFRSWMISWSNQFHKIPSRIRPYRFTWLLRIQPFPVSSYLKSSVFNSKNQTMTGFE